MSKLCSACRKESLVLLSNPDNTSKRVCVNCYTNIINKVDLKKVLVIGQVDVSINNTYLLESSQVIYPKIY